ncbi:MAG: glutamate--cysteine ligase [Legionellales bacterium]|nr:glutamate--cysteine ligase [Legionellales bacterium]|tara:strand:+ start:2034 stop:3329 length:1296 start_codon:yes stop_codon:yes gene_type:complete
MSEIQTADVPHLLTAITGPLRHLEKHILEHQVAIETWFRKQWQVTPAPIHSSVDLRNSGFKVAPVDTNLFPAGFNNLNPEFMPLCIQAAQSTIENHYPGCDKILLIPESHTRNLFYLESLHTLQTILQKAGFDVRIGTLLEQITAAKDFELPSGNRITLEPVVRTGAKVGVDGFSPCMVMLNNDMSEGTPEILQGIDQPIRPPLDLGWSKRLKSIHFDYYQKVAEQFAEVIDIDPWLINPLFRSCGEVDFMRREGEECLVQNSELLLNQIQKKYQEYGVEDTPFIAMKADAGTYGMGVMMVDNPEQISQLNRKERSKMAAGKGKQTVNKVILQEGVFSFETLGEENSVAEPVVYLLGHHVVGGFYRVHKGRASNENLNAPGMHFEPLAFADCCNNPDSRLKPHDTPNRFYTYGVIARLAVLAAARELKDVS